MIYLTGVTNDRDEQTLIESGIGLMCQPGSGYANRATRYPFWAADNGAFSDKWNEDKWIRWLENCPRDLCLFAVAPDVYPDAEATLERSEPFLPIIRELGFPVALVAQDGAESLLLPWGDFDCLFIGGERTHNPWFEWKVSRAAERLVRQARSKGKWVHMGRVNSLTRMRRAQEMGCHSADGTFLKYRYRVAASDGEGDRAWRGAGEIDNWVWHLDTEQQVPDFESPALPMHREAQRVMASRRARNQTMKGILSA